MEDASGNKPEDEIQVVDSLGNFVEYLAKMKGDRLGYPSDNPFTLLREFALSPLLDVREAILGRLSELFRCRDFRFCRGLCQLIESVIRQLIQKSQTKQAERLTGLYVFAENSDPVATIAFCLSLIDERHSGDSYYARSNLMLWLSKIVCAKLMQSLPQACYNRENGASNASPYEIWPGLRAFLIAIIDSRLHVSYIVSFSGIHGSEFKYMDIEEFHPVERVLRLVIKLLPFDAGFVSQCFLSRLETCLKLNRHDCLKCGTGHDSEQYFEHAKCLAVLRETAKHLQKAKNKKRLQLGAQ